MKNIKSTKNIENIGRGRWLGKPPHYPHFPIPDPTPNSVQFQTLTLSFYYWTGLNFAYVVPIEIRIKK